MNKDIDYLKDIHDKAKTEILNSNRFMACGAKSDTSNEYSVPDNCISSKSAISMTIDNYLERFK
jgi:hypothetical protein